MPKRIPNDGKRDRECPRCGCDHVWEHGLSPAGRDRLRCTHCKYAWTIGSQWYKSGRPTMTLGPCWHCGSFATRWNGWYGEMHRIWCSECRKSSYPPVVMRKFLARQEERRQAKLAQKKPD